MAENSHIADRINFKAEYDEKLKIFAEHLQREKRKGKVPFIFTGLGVSKDVPNMDKMLKKLNGLIDEKFSGNEKSDTLNRILDEYNANNSDPTAQSKLLTYIQNAYLHKDNFVHELDLKPLEAVWCDFIFWLLYECIQNEDETFHGLIKAEATPAHNAIAKMCKATGAIPITTNFDNLLSMSELFADESFYPLLEEKTLHRYFTDITDDKSYIEIQARGDVFWIECTGNKNKTCSNIGCRCYVPGAHIRKDESGSIVCNNCGSSVHIYFAFPGTKEKDFEMSKVMKNLWKFIAYRCSAVIVAGSSMNYDPVLLSFIQELISRRNIPLIYISRVREGKEPSENKATRTFFNGKVHEKTIWARVQDAAEALDDLAATYESLRPLDFVYIEDCKAAKDSYTTQIITLIGKVDENSTMKEGVISPFTLISGINPDKLDSVKNSVRYSQLGLKTYWLRDDSGDKKIEHNRFKHSLGVAIISSVLYLAAKKESSTKDELQFLQLAALLHDIGHLPFSHLVEEIFDEFGWVSSGSSVTFNHEHLTNIRIAKFMRDDYFNELLARIGYTSEDLINLIHGEFGVGFLDALINSPIDADKIEYLFTDSIFTNAGDKKQFIAFINQLQDGLSVSTNCMLAVEGKATQKMMELLEMRGQMYSSIYLRKGLRYLEACCKLIMRTFFAYKCTEPEMFNKIGTEAEPRMNNLSDVKIQYVIDFLIIDRETSEPVELAILKEMAEYLEAQPHLSTEIKSTIKHCMKLIKETNGADKVDELEKKKIRTWEISGANVDRTTLKKLTKSVYLRFPGVLLVDYVKSKAAFSFAESGKKINRADGTCESVENILIRQINPSAYNRKEDFRCLSDTTSEIVRYLNIPTHEYINLYRLTTDPFQYMQAEDYVISELRKSGVNI